jgi:hypothetical protein
MNTPSSLIKNWTLLRYAVEINHHSPLSSPNSRSSNERQELVFVLLDIHIPHSPSYRTIDHNVN